MVLSLLWMLFQSKVRNSIKEKYFMFGDVEMVTNYKIKVDIGKGRFYSNTNAKFDFIY